MAKMLHPLAEVFGFPTTDMSAKANRHRTKRLCPFKVLYRFDASYCDEEIILVEADGFGGAVLRVVEGNYPTDFLTREEQIFQTEYEAIKAAKLFHQSVAA